ncbi:MAG: hypothetical protein ACK4GT_03130, partial [Pararhodobacter sp.]
ITQEVAGISHNLMGVRSTFLSRLARQLRARQARAGTGGTGGPREAPFPEDACFAEALGVAPHRPAEIDIDRFARSIGLRNLALRAKYRFPHHPEQPDLLPDPDSFDSDSARHRILVALEQQPARSRHNMEDQLALLRNSFSDRPEILLWHALAISYLRRKTPHTEKAKALFFRIWDEQHLWLAENLNARWLISALQTFADHGRTPREVQCGAMGFMYGNLIKVYETEIASAYHHKEPVERYRGGKIRGLFAFQPGDDILVNINTFAYAAALEAGPAGIALSRLLSIVKQGESIFSRTDEITSRNGRGHLSFLGALKTRGDD